MAVGAKIGQFHQLTSTWHREQGAAQSPWAAGQGEEEGEEEEEEEEEGPGPQWLVLELGRVSLAAASSGHSPYLSEDFVSMETLMSSALQQPQPRLQLFFLFSFPPWFGVFIYFFESFSQEMTLALALPKHPGMSTSPDPPHVIWGYWGVPGSPSGMGLHFGNTHQDRALPSVH